MVIKECTNHDEIIATFHVMRQLRPKLEHMEDYFQLIKSLQQTEGYKLIAMFDADKNCMALAGIRIKRSLFSNGKAELYVDDLVTDSSCRSQGLGKKMLSWLKEECKKLGCSSLILDSGNQRIEAHKFYYRENLQMTALHFSWAAN